MLAGRIDLVDGGLEIDRRRNGLNDTTYEPLENIALFADEVRDYPRDGRRALWPPEALERFDRRYGRYIEQSRAGILADCETIVRDFGRNTG